jgi:inorganic pyrophosphatase
MEDDKLIAVHVDNPAYADYTSHEQLSQHLEKQIRCLFEDYKALEGKRVVVDDFLGVDVVQQVPLAAMNLYNQQSHGLVENDR